MASDIYDEMFENTVSCRDALAGKYQWLTHDTPYICLASIRKNGLVPLPVSACPSEVLIRLGESGRKIACLHPVGAELRPQSSGAPPFVRLAMRSVDLPDQLSLDWSYDWSLARVIRQDLPDRSCCDVFLDVARRRGSIAVYDGVPVLKLRIWREGLPDDPAQWPKLAAVADTEVKKFTYDSPNLDL